MLLYLDIRAVNNFAPFFFFFFLSFYFFIFLGGGGVVVGFGEGTSHLFYVI
jgi:hypothetical protein